MNQIIEYESNFFFVAVLVLSLSMAAQSKSFYDFSVKTIDGKEYKLADLKGKKVLVVNVASKCGLTPQYAELQNCTISIKIGIL